MSKEEKAGFLTVLVMFIAINIGMWCGNMTEETAWKECKRKKCNEQYHSADCIKGRTHDGHDLFPLAFEASFHNITEGNFLNTTKSKLEDFTGSQTIASTATTAMKVCLGIMMGVTIVVDMLLYIAFSLAKILLLVCTIVFLFFALPCYLLYKLSLLTLTSGEKCKTLWEAMRRKNEEKQRANDKNVC